MPMLFIELIMQKNKPLKGLFKSEFMAKVFLLAIDYFSVGDF